MRNSNFQPHKPPNPLTQMVANLAGASMVIAAGKIWCAWDSHSPPESATFTIYHLQLAIVLFTALRFHMGDSYYFDRRPLKILEPKAGIPGIKKRFKSRLALGYEGFLLELLSLVNGGALLFLAYCVGTVLWFDFCFACMLLVDVLVLALLVHCHREKVREAHPLHGDMIIIRHPAEDRLPKRWMINNTCAVAAYCLLAGAYLLGLINLQWFSMACIALWFANSILDIFITPEIHQ